MAEITSPDYPGERLVVCKNPLLAEERARKRAELLAATEKELARIAARVQRARNPLRGTTAISPETDGSNTARSIGWAAAGSN